MKEMEAIKPCKTFEAVGPLPEGYELQVDNNFVLAVDPTGAKPTLYWSFPARDRGWKPFKARRRKGGWPRGRIGNSV